MSRIFAGSVGAIVATRTVAGDINVIKVRRGPARSRMAVVAGFATSDMRWRLTRCDVAVMAGLATANDLGVIDHGGWRPKINAMTVFAHSGS